jgi:hypothetical protein
MKTIHRILWSTVTALLGVLPANAYGDTSAGTLAPEQWSTPIAGLSIGIAVASDPLIAGRPMPVNVFLKNASARTMRLARPLTEYGYQVIVLENGQVLKQLPEVATASVYSDMPVATLNTGDVDTETFDLAKLYALRPGTYTLMLTLAAHVDSSKDTVNSVAPPVVFSVE